MPKLVPVGGSGGSFPITDPYLSGGSGQLTQADLPSSGKVEATSAVIEEGTTTTIQDTLYIFATEKIEIRANALIDGKGNGSSGGSGGYGTGADGSPGSEGVMGGNGGNAGSGGWARAGYSYEDGGRGADGGNSRSVSANKQAAYYAIAVSSSFSSLPNLGGAGGGGGGGGAAAYGSGTQGGRGGNGGAGLVLCAPEIVVDSSAVVDLRGADGEDGETAPGNISGYSGAGGGGGGGGGDCAAVGESVTIPSGVVKTAGGQRGAGGGEGFPEDSSDGNSGSSGSSGDLITP